MTQMNVVEAARDQYCGYKLDVNRSERIGRVSSEWFSRPAHEWYPSLSELFAAVRGCAERRRPWHTESVAIRMEVSRDDAERLALGAHDPLA